MQKVLVVDFNGTSSVYTHYFSKGLESETVQVKILGKKKDDFLDVFNNLQPYIGFNSGVKLLDYLLNWIWLLFNYKKFDLIVIQWLQLLYYTSLEITLINYLQNKIRLIYVLHNLYPHNNQNERKKVRYNHLYKTLKNIAVHTNGTKKQILKINPNIHVYKINHGLFFEEFKSKNTRIIKNKCLIIGYLTKYKGVEDALEVVKRLKEQNTIINLEIVGLANPEYLKKLTRIIEDNHIENQVVILSKEVSTKYLINKINTAKMLWLPYKNISQSGVTYTSIGLGKVFVGYDVGNFKSDFGDTGVAKIVEKGNIDQFCDAVCNLLENIDDYEKNIKNFSSQNLWDKNKKVLK